MIKHGVSRPMGHETWDLFIWHEMAATIRGHFKPELADTKNEYYKQIASIAKVLNRAYRSGHMSVAISSSTASTICS